MNKKEKFRQVMRGCGFKNQREIAREIFKCTINDYSSLKSVENSLSKFLNGNIKYLPHELFMGLISVTKLDPAMREFVEVRSENSFRLNKESIKYIYSGKELCDKLVEFSEQAFYSGETYKNSGLLMKAFDFKLNLQAHYVRNYDIFTDVSREKINDLFLYSEKILLGTLNRV